MSDSEADSPLRRRRPPPGTAAAAAVFALLMAVAGRYGFHRDELYFIEAGRHPALAYPDQPALIPLLATGWHDLVGGSLTAFRLVPAAAGAVLVSAATSLALGGSRRDAEWTGLVVGTATTLLVAGHLFNTTVFDILLTSAAVLALIRALRTTSWVAWIALGLVAAVALLVKTLPLIVLGCCALGLLAAGPRSAFRTPRPWVAAGIAAVGLVPGLVWQAANGWPQLSLAESISSGGSGTSVGRLVLVPMLFTLTGVTFFVVLLGAVAAWRRPDLRWLAVAAVALVGVLLLTGGKPYYAFGLVPALVAAGIPGVLGWARGTGRRALLAGVVAVNAVIGAMLGLPVLPAARAPVAVIYDQGEQIGWSEFVATVRSAAERSDPDVILTQNYGQAGALSAGASSAGALSAGASTGERLPPVHSGHNAYWWWGPPKGEPTRVLTIGWRDATDLRRWFGSCQVLAEVSNGAGVDNDELGTPVRICTPPVGPWAELWPQMRRLG